MNLTTSQTKMAYQFARLMLVGRRNALLALLLVTVINVAAAFGSPVLIKELGQARTIKGALLLATFLLFVGSVNALMTHYSNVIGANLVYRGIAHIRLQIQRSVYQAPPGLDEAQLGNFQQTAYRRLNSAGSSLMNGVIPMLSALLTLIANAVAVVVIAGRFSLLPLLLLVPSLLISLRIGRARALALAARSTANRVYTYVVQAVLGHGGLERLRLHGAPYLLKRYEETVEMARETSFKNERMASQMQVPLSIGGVTTTASLLVVALLINMQASAAAAILAAVGQMTAALTQAVRSWVRVQEMKSPMENTLKALNLSVLPAYACSTPNHRRRARLKPSRSSWRLLRADLRFKRRLWLVEIRYQRRLLIIKLVYRFRLHCIEVGGSSYRASWRLFREIVQSASRRCRLRSLAYRGRHRMGREHGSTHKSVTLRKSVAQCAGSPEIRLVNVSYTAQDGPAGQTRTLIHPVTLNLRPGNVYTFLGRTGEGKSTLAKLLCGLIDPTQGTVSIAGLDLRGLRWGDRRSLLVALLAPRFIKDASIREILTTAIGVEDLALIQRVLVELGLDEFDLDDDPTKLSKGQQQLLAIAEAILKMEVNPQIKVLIMDEHTVFLDPEAREIAERALARYYDNRIVVIMASKPWDADRPARPVTVYDIKKGHITPR